MKKIILFLGLLVLGLQVYAQSPTTSASAPMEHPLNVVSIFSDTYANLSIVNYDPNWGQSGHTLVNTTFDPTGSGTDFVLAYPNFNYQGTDFGSNEDLSDMESLHVDIWVDAGVTGRMVKVSPINNGSGASEFLVEVPITPGSWNSVMLPKSDFTGMTWDSVFQLKFDGQFNADGSANTTPFDIYVDNIYFSGPPLNDDCDNAIALTINGDLSCTTVTSATNVMSTASAQADDVTGTPDNDVWFSFVATNDSHEISLSNKQAIVGTSTDMGMGLYDGTGGCSGLVFFDDSDPDTLSATGLTAGATYYLRVYGWYGSTSASYSETTFDVCVGTPPPPAQGSDCSDPIVINSLPYNTTDDTANYGDDYENGDSPCNSNYMSGDDVVYSFTPATDGTYKFLLSNIGSTWSGIHILDGCLDATPVCVGFEGNSGTADREVNAGLTGGTTYYIVISTWASPQTTTYTLDITEVVCPEPSGLSAINITSDSAELSWTAGSAETEWEVLWGPTGFDPSTDGTLVNDDDGVLGVNLSGLTENTSYDFYVTAVCGPGSTSPQVGPFTFSTSCNSFLAPFTEDFSALAIPACWSQGAANAKDWEFTDDPAGDNVGDDGSFTTSSASGGGYAWLDDSSPHSQDTRLETPFIDVSGLASAGVSFYYISNNQGDLNVDFRVEVWDGAAWNQVFFSNQNTPNGEWTQISLDLSALTFTGDIKVAFVVDENNGIDFNDDIAIDDVTVDEVSGCITPSNVVSSNITSASADFSWDNTVTATNGYEWVLMASGDAPDPAAALFTNTELAGVSNTSIASLAENTAYDFYVRSLCDAGATSDWSIVSTISTPCNAFVAPFTEDFSALALPNCWSQGAANAKDWEFTDDPSGDNVGNDGSFISSSASGGGYAWVDESSPHSLDTRLESPFIDVSTLNVPALSFYYISNNQGDDNVDFRVEVWDGAAWNQVFFSNQNTSGGEWEQVLVDISGLTITGNIKLAFIVDENNGNDFNDDIAIDDVVVDEAPTCVPPSGLASANLTSSSFDASWVDSSTSTDGYEWVLMPGGDMPDTTTALQTGTTADGVVTETFTGLNGSTSYSFYVRSNCGTEGFSDWSSSLTVFTLPSNDNICDAIDILVGTVSAPDAYSTTGATAQAGEPDMDGQANGGITNSVWFKFVAPASGRVLVSTDIPGGTLVDSEIAIYEEPTDCTDASTMGAFVAFDQDSGVAVNFNSVIVTGGLVPGDTYYVQVDRWNSASDGTFGIEIQEAIADVQVIHNSADPTAEFVDVYLDGVLTFDDFEFRNATSFVSVPAGEDVSIDIAPGTSTDVSESLYNLTTTLDIGETYVVVANGVLDPTQFDASVNTIDFELSVFAGAQQASTNAGETSILINHGSTDAPSVDVVEVSVPAGTLADDLAYPQFAGYVDVPTADYIINIELADNSAVVASYQAPLATLGTSDLALTVVASGFLDPAANQNGAVFGLWAALPTGGALVELPLFIPPPANDNACDAIPLTVGAPSAGDAYTNVSATAEANEPVAACFNGDINGSVWFTFVAPLSGDVTVTTDIAGGTLNDTEIAVYDAPGDCTDLSTFGAELGCDQDGGSVVNFNSILSLAGLTPGNTYYVQVDQWGTAVPGSFGIRVLDNNPPCPEPTSLSATAITSDSATLNWDDVAVATLGYEWSVYASPSDITSDTPLASGTTGAGVTSADVAGLMPETDYDFYVFSDCDVDGQSILAGPATFTTGCAAIIPDYEENFDSFLPDCWNEAGSGDPTTGPSDIGTSFWGADGFLNNGFSGSASINLFTDNTEDWLLSPAFDLSGGTYELVFDIGITAFSGNGDSPMGSDDEVQLLYSEDGGTTWVNLQTWAQGTEPSNAGEKLTYDLSAITAANVQFAFWGTDGTVNDPEDYNIYIDNFEVRTPPNCPEPLNLLVSNITLDSADLSWDDVVEATNGYTWSIYNSPSDPTVDTPVATGNTPAGMTMANVTGLMSGSDFDFYLQADCDTNGTSVLVGPVTFSTLPDFCAGDLFYDNGGPGGDYAVNSNETTTISPSNVGDVVTVEFLSFATELNYDGIQIYDGPDTSAPLIDSGFTNPGFGPLASGTWTGNATDPSGGASSAEGVTFISTHPTGALTFVFTSDGSVVDTGWEAVVTCGPAPTPASVQVIHNSADPAAQLVDVYVNGALTLDDFAFRTATPFVDLPAETQISIDVAPSTSADVSESIYNLTTTLTSGESYVVVANGVLDPTQFDNTVNTSIAFNLDVFAGAQQTAPSATENSILVHHGSTDAPTVDVVEASVPLGIVADDISYTDFQGYVTVPNGDYIINIESADNSSVVASYEANLASFGGGALSGSALTVVASGFLNSAANQNGASFGLWAASPLGGPLEELPLIQPAIASVQIIHNSADPLAQNVDIYINGNLEFANVAFRTASPFVDVPAGNLIDIDVAPAGSTDVSESIYNYQFVPIADLSYILVANGVLDPTQFDQTVNPSIAFGFNLISGVVQTALNPGETSVLVHHGSTDAPTVDIVETSVPAGILVDNVSYPNFSTYVTVPTADYVLNVELADNSAVVASYEANLATLGTADLAITVLASGFLDPIANQNGAGFGLWAALPTGGALIELPLITVSTAGFQFDNFSFYPNPVENNVYLQSTSVVEQVKVINMLGQEVLSQLPNNVSPILNVETLQSGTYIMRVTIDGTSKNFKFVKE